MKEMENFVSSGSEAARSMYGILNRTEAWYKAFPSNEEGNRSRTQILENGISAFFWHVASLAEKQTPDELKEIGIESVQQIVSQNPAVLYVAMEHLCGRCDEGAAEEVFAEFSQEWQQMTGEQNLGEGYSKSRAKKKLQQVRSLFGLEEASFS